MRKSYMKMFERDHQESVMKKAVNLALDGDKMMIKFLLDRFTLKSDLEEHIPFLSASDIFDKYKAGKVSHRIAMDTLNVCLKYKELDNIEEIMKRLSDLEAAAVKR